MVLRMKNLDSLPIWGRGRSLARKSGGGISAGGWYLNAHYDSPHRDLSPPPLQIYEKTLSHKILANFQIKSAIIMGEGGSKKHV